jgi:hypothetical protein
VNLSSFIKNTASYRKTLSTAAEDAVPLSKAIFYEDPVLERNNPSLEED